MRKIERIKRILKLIEDKWIDAPDLRFGQLLINIGVVNDSLYVWNMQDEDLEKHLKKFKW